MIVYRSTNLNASTDEVWEALKLRDTFLSITRGVLSYEGSESWPKVLMSPGIEIQTVVHPLCLLPGTPHTFKIVNVDEELREIHTNEHGGFIRVWNHTMKVAPISDTCCRYSDRVEIDAGPVTPLIWVLANSFYWLRQCRWRRLAVQLEIGRGLSH